MKLYTLYTLDNEFIEKTYTLPDNFTGIVKYEYGTKSWWLNGKQHRTDGPAIEWHYGDREWWVNNILHRIGGPAIERADGTNIWCIVGKEVSKEEHDLLKIVLDLKKLQ